jgi:hypothetical protein
VEHEDVREPNPGANLPLGIQHGVQSSNIGEVAIDVRMQFAQLIASRPAVDDARQVLSTATQHPIKIHLLEFLGQNAADGVGIVPLERLRPGLFKSNQGALLLSLPGWTTATKSKRTNQKREP